MELTPTYSIFQSILQNEIMWLRDTGILNRLTLDIKRPPMLIPQEKVRYKLPLTISQMSSTLISVLVGSVLSVIVFIREIACRSTVTAIKLTEHMIELD